MSDGTTLLERPRISFDGWMKVPSTRVSSRPRLKLLRQQSAEFVDIDEYDEIEVVRHDVETL